MDGVIVPDLPMYEYENLYKDNFINNNLSNIFLVTPQTSEERIGRSMNSVMALFTSFLHHPLQVNI